MNPRFPRPILLAACLVAYLAMRRLLRLPRLLALGGAAALLYLLVRDGGEGCCAGDGAADETGGAASTGPSCREAGCGCDCAQPAESADDPAHVAAEGAPLEGTPEWEEIVGAFEAAEAAAAAPEAPLDETGKLKLLARLDDGVETLAALAASGRLAPAEAGILGVEADRLTGLVHALPTEERRREAGFEPANVIPARDGLRRLEARLPFLAELSASDRVRPEVLFRTLTAVSADADILGDGKETRLLTVEERERAAKTRHVVADALRRLRGEAV